ncbi:DUF4199 domain-containing protein [Crocinitomicaceae bacterium]|nr:DUF4199 domain-containing protein [Crocinitomicaceae bacterium]|tara:strand:+ start:382 stop:960 length:579 start_codon:yes stop_codon:yes gene_type:complete
MKITVQVGLLFAAIWIVIKMILFYTDSFGNNIVPSGMINILCVLLAISVGMYKFKRAQIHATSFLTDIKSGMTAGVPYTLIVSVFMFLFYSKIDPDFISHKVSDITYEMKQRVDDPVKLKRLREDNEDFEVMSKEQIYDRMTQGPLIFASAKFTMVITLLALLLLSTLNSIFVAIIYRKVVFKDAHANLLDE